ncbi:MAG: enoyl-CoA hydratase-related protein [Lautropia sp.]
MDILLQEERDGVLILTLNRPEARNALSSELAERMLAVLEAAADRWDLRMIVIRGAGDDAFCAGTDLKERRHLTPDGKWAQRTRGWNVNQFLWRMPQPVVSLIHGWCLGGGFELALFCDLRIASPDAVFSFPEMTLGAYPGSGAAIMLPRQIGRARAKELFFTARRVKADEALELGIVEWVVPREKMLDKAMDMAAQIRMTSPLGVGAVKRMVNLGADLSFDGAADLNDALRRPLEATRDYEEGLQAFFEKRKPVFKGE